MPCSSKTGPTWLQKVSFILDYAMDTCSTPWEVYLRTGGRALGNLAMTMVYVDTGDLVRSFFRPKAARSGRHAMPWLGRGKKRIKPGLFPEPSDLIADTFRSASDMKKPRYSDGFNHIWTVDTHLQKVANKVVFANMATDFGYDWFSGIILDPQSKCNRGRFSCGYEIGPYNSNNFELPHRAGSPQYQNGATCAAGQIVLGEGLWAITYAARVTPLSGTEGDEFDFILMVGDTEHMKPCGKLLKLHNLGPGKFDFGEQWSTVKGPDFVRVIGKTNGYHGIPLGSTIQIVRGFRMD